MRLSLNWIRDYVKLPDDTPAEMARKVTMATVEVEEVIEQRLLLEGIYVGKVLEVTKHPKADRLWVCTVSIKSEELQIICGGTNVATGMLVAVATVGSRVRWHGEGDLITLEQAKIRGIESRGMIAAANEIGLAGLFGQHGEREILDLTPLKVKVGDPLADALGLNDAILVIDNKSMTHRPDLWGQYGLARELAALYDLKLKPLKPKEITSPRKAVKPLTVTVSDPALCARYTAVVLDNITPRESPWWLKARLESVGVSSVNSIVDVTNYVMMACGQPMHAFDYHALAGHSITVEPAGRAVEVHGLNDKRYSVLDETLMVNDAKGPIAIAGIIGGMESRVTETTTTVVFESAHFAPASVRRSSIGLGLRTESSSRFEKGLDPAMAMVALHMAVELSLSIHPGASIAGPVIDVRTAPGDAAAIELELARLDAVLGHSVEPKEAAAILKRLGFAVASVKGLLRVSVPSFRSRDIVSAEDLIEEVARIYGYDRIEPVLPRVQIIQPERNTPLRLERDLKTSLAYVGGYSEVQNYSFADPAWTEELGLARGAIAVRNYLNPGQKMLRTSLIPQLVPRVIENKRWFDDYKLFEVGRIFANKQGEYPATGDSGSYVPAQPRSIAGIVFSKTGSAKEVFLQAKGAVEFILERIKIKPDIRPTPALSKALAGHEVRVHDKTAGFFGLFASPKLTRELAGCQVAWWELSLDVLAQFADFSRSYEQPSKYPAVVRDLSIVVHRDTPWQRVADRVQGASSLLRRIELFDEFASPKIGIDKKSFAFRLTFLSDRGTLESSQVDTAIRSIIRKIEDEFDAEVR